MLKNLSEKDFSLKMLFVISDADKAETVLKLLKKWHVGVLHQFHAEGTASSEMLDIFGLGGMSKTVSVCMLPGFMTESLLSEASETLKLKARGGGIAFTAPLSGIAFQAMRKISDEYSKHYSAIADRLTEKVEAHMEYVKENLSKIQTDAACSLIIAFIDQGYSDQAVSAAREAGAVGGTVWTARRAGSESAGILGLSIQGEREILMIITPKSKKLDIMKAINNDCGITTPAHGIIVSLPIEETIGLYSENSG